MAFGIERAVISAPHVVRWAGFESTTPRMQQCGWEFSAEQSDYNMRVRLAARHQDFRIYGVSSYVSVDRFSYDRKNGPLIFEFKYMASDLRVQLNEMDFAFRPVDARPQIVTVRSIDDMNIFAAPLARTEEIIVDPQDVMAMLEQIKRMQAPGQADIRKRDGRRELDEQPGPRQVFHAQILSLAEAA